VGTTAGVEAVRGVFAREGEYWTLAYRDRLTRLADSKGLRHIAHLLAHPGQPMHALDLIALTDPPPEQSEAAHNESSTFDVRIALKGDGGETLDTKARDAYTRRLRELREELDEARELGRESRALEAEAEIEALTAHLKSSLGIGGRARKSGSAAERARLAVSKSIGRALESITAANPEFGRLLETTIKTGTFCSYQPDLRFPIEWQLQPPVLQSHHQDMREGAFVTLPIGAHLSDVLPAATNSAASMATPPIEAEPAAPHITRPQMATTIAISALGLVAIALTIAVAYRARLLNAFHSPTPAIESTSPSIAALPFTNLSTSKDDEYFSDGMTDEIIGDLSKVTGLKVAAPTSSFVFKGRSEAADKIADSLHVHNLLEGSVRRSANRLRIEVELIDARSGFTIWSERYDRDTTDIFAIQSDVAENVAEKLKVSLLPEESARVRRKPTDNQEAYDLYLQGIYAESKFSEEDDQKAIGYLKRALAADPNFANAHAGLASIYANSSDWYFAPRQSMPIAKAEAERAMALDNELAEPHLALALYQLQFEWNWPLAEREYKRAIELAPTSAVPHGNYGNALGYMGRYDDGMRELQRAIELDPFGIFWFAFAGDVSARRRDYAQASRFYQHEIEMAPQSWVGYFDRGRLFADEGNLPAAIKDMERSVALTANPMAKAILGPLYAAAGRRADALKILQQMREASKHRFVSPAFFAGLYWSLGDKDQAFRFYDEAYEGRSTIMSALREPAFNSMRSDPRFQALEKKIGLYN
jgi:serine/threonine-protein kinase